MKKSWIRAFSFIILTVSAVVWGETIHAGAGAEIGKAGDSHVRAFRVEQALSASACTSTINNHFLLSIPDLSYASPSSGIQSFRAEFIYTFNPTFPTVILFKFVDAQVNVSDRRCVASTLSSDLKLHIPEILFPDGTTRLWADLEYSPALSTDVDVCFVVTGYGQAADTAITGINWQWIELVETASASQLIIPTPEIYTLFLKPDGTLNIQADCNRLAGTYTWNGNSLGIKVLTSTMAYCGDQSLDQKYLALLDQVESFAVAGGRLMLYLCDGNGNMTFKQE